ncbi:hypothetical protein J6590_067968 [Homalodisca vitripennis]|nr:hypothetical protein J6590_067968 [Homalodisca vitripennis]
MFCKLYDVEGELILINGSGWSAGIIPPHLMLVSNPTPQPLLPLYCPNAVGSASALTFKHVFNLPARLPLGYDPTTTQEDIDHSGVQRCRCRQVHGRFSVVRYTSAV